MQTLSSVVVAHNPNKNIVDAAVIWLHGLGANGHDFVPIVPQLQLHNDLAVRFIFPNAPSMPITINNGYVMPAWYDILEMSLDRRVDIEHVLSSSQSIEKIIEGEIESGISEQRIIIAGFSQGGVIAYQTVLHYPRRLGGLLALSTYLVNEATLGEAKLVDLPICIMHGCYDDIVPESMGKKAHQTLQKLGYQPKWHSYPMAHQVCNQQIADIGHWLNMVLKKH